MRVQFTQSGGLVGTTRGCTLDTAALSEDEARALEALVQHADLSGPREALSASGRDLEQYEISVDAGGTAVTVTRDQSTMSPGTKALVAHLKKSARPEPPILS